MNYMVAQGHSLPVTIEFFINPRYNMKITIHRQTTAAPSMRDIKFSRKVPY